MSKVLFVLSSAKTSPWGKDTGYWLEEVAAPYNHLVELGFNVEISSIEGMNHRVTFSSLLIPYLNAIVILRSHENHYN
jgi:hypothetical protein